MRLEGSETSKKESKEAKDRTLGALHCFGIVRGGKASKDIKSVVSEQEGTPVESRFSPRKSQGLAYGRKDLWIW